MSATKFNTVCSLFLSGLLILSASCGSAGHIASPNSVKLETPRIVFIGDSVTECMVTNVPGRCTSVPGLPLMAGWQGIDKGESGETTADILARYQRDVIDQQTWPDGITATANVVVIEENTNDYIPSPQTRALPLAQTEANILTMVSQSQTAGQRVVIQTMIPTTHIWTPFALAPNLPFYYNGDYIRLYNLFLSRIPGVELADTYKAVVDLSTCTSGQCFIAPAMTEDGIHPSAAGFAAMFPVIENAIQAATEQ